MLIDLQLWRKRGKVDLLEELLHVDQKVGAPRARSILLLASAASGCCMRSRIIKLPCAQLADLMYEIGQWETKIRDERDVPRRRYAQGSIPTCG